MSTRRLQLEQDWPTLIAQMLSAGETYRSIAAAVGARSHQSVATWLDGAEPLYGTGLRLLKLHADLVSSGKIVVLVQSVHPISHTSGQATGLERLTAEDLKPNW